MYILKTKGIAKIPDYVQIRDKDFVLICHFRADKPHMALNKQNFKKPASELVEIINNLPFGKLTEVDL